MAAERVAISPPSATRASDSVKDMAPKRGPRAGPGDRSRRPDCATIPIRSMTRARPQVVRHGHRDDLVELQRLESECQDGPRAFGGVAPAPVFGRQSPADLHARREGRLEAGNRKADESRERRDVGNLHRPQSETVPIEVGLDTGDQRVAFVPRQAAGRYRITLGSAFMAAKGTRSAGDPSPEPQPLGSKLSRQDHRFRTSVSGLQRHDRDHGPPERIRGTTPDYACGRK